MEHVFFLFCPCPKCQIQAACDRFDRNTGDELGFFVYLHIYNDNYCAIIKPYLAKNIRLISIRCSRV